jgi:arylsulfatase A-like enzyme
VYADEVGDHDRPSVRPVGTYTVVPGAGPIGLTPWEYTIAELLSDAGYATSLFGKWHLGEVEGRLPTDQGFDEWWGYRNSANECGWTSYAAYKSVAKAFGIYTPMIWEGKKGGEQTAVREMDLEVRPLLDELIVGKATDYIKAHAKDDQPFFTYVALSHVQFPEQPHPDFNQTDPERFGPYADLMAEQDYRVGQIVDCVEQAGIGDNTLIVFLHARIDTRAATRFRGSVGSRAPPRRRSLAGRRLSRDPRWRIPGRAWRPRPWRCRSRSGSAWARP